MRTPYLIVAAVLLTVACNQQKGGDGVRDHGASSLRDLAKPDGSGQARIIVVVAPTHLMSNLPTTTRVELALTSSGVWDDQTLVAALKGAFSLVSLPGKTSVPGQLTASLDTKSGLFVPTSPLTGNTEYAVAIQKTATVTPVRTNSLFHVGSLPRVRQISFFPATPKASEVGQILVRFSEEVDVVKAAAALTAKVVKTGATVSTSVAGAASKSSEILFDVVAGVSLSEKLAITLGTDVGAATGVKLDGKYSGVADSGALQLELVPADYGVDGKAPWEPAMQF